MSKFRGKIPGDRRMRLGSARNGEHRPGQRALCDSRSHFFSESDCPSSKTVTSFDLTTFPSVSDSSSRSEYRLGGTVPRDCDGQQQEISLAHLVLAASILKSEELCLSRCTFRGACLC